MIIVYFFLDSKGKSKTEVYKFIHPTNTYYVPGIVLGARDIAVNKKSLLMWSLNPGREKQTINNM